MAFTFSFETVVQRYRVYAAMDGIELPCKREIGKHCDPFVPLVKVWKDYLAE